MGAVLENRAGHDLYATEEAALAEAARQARRSGVRLLVLWRAEEEPRTHQLRWHWRVCSTPERGYRFRWAVYPDGSLHRDESAIPARCPIGRRLAY